MRMHDTADFSPRQIAALMFLVGALSLLVYLSALALQP
jgi:hypothetical protein